MQNENDILTQEHIEEYAAHLREQERAENTVQKYRSDLAALRRWLGGRPLAKLVLIQWKEHLALTYAATSVNSMLAALNGLLQFMGRGEMAVKPLRIQKRLFCDEGRELTKKEYVRLVETARGEGNERLALVLQTLCATGIRVSELPYITAKAVRLGRDQQQGEAADGFSAGQTAQAAEALYAEGGLYGGCGVRDQNGEASGPLQYLERYEETVQKRRSGAGEGVPSQSPPLICANLLRFGEGYFPSGGHPWAHRYRYHPYIYNGKRANPRPSDRTDEIGDYIIRLMLYLLYSYLLQ